MIVGIDRRKDERITERADPLQTLKNDLVKSPQDKILEEASNTLTATLSSSLVRVSHKEGASYKQCNRPVKCRLSLPLQDRLAGHMIYPTG